MQFFYTEQLFLSVSSKIDWLASFRIGSHVLNASIYSLNKCPEIRDNPGFSPSNLQIGFFNPAQWERASYKVKKIFAQSFPEKYFFTLCSG